MKRVANITAAIPTLDRPEALECCLERLFMGRVLPAEVLIIDQAQEDTVRSVIRCFQSDITPIIHSRQPEMGLSAARNLASYHVIAFTDEDCVPDPNWIAQLQQTMNCNQEPVYQTG